MTELKGEKIDIVNFSTDPHEFVANALSPAKVIGVYPKANEKVAVVIVPDYQLSLAIGKEGQNARLAAKLTGWKIDIKSESQAMALNLVPGNPEGDYDTFEDYGEFEEYMEYDDFAEDGYQEYEQEYIDDESALDSPEQDNPEMSDDYDSEKLYVDEIVDVPDLNSQEPEVKVKKKKGKG